mgnify:CR=1 FL=1
MPKLQIVHSIAVALAAEGLPDPDPDHVRNQLGGPLLVHVLVPPAHDHVLVPDLLQGHHLQDQPLGQHLTSLVDGYFTKGIIYTMNV